MCALKVVGVLDRRSLIARRFLSGMVLLLHPSENCFLFIEVILPFIQVTYSGLCRKQSSQQVCIFRVDKLRASSSSS